MQASRLSQNGEKFTKKRNSPTIRTFRFGNFFTLIDTVFAFFRRGFLFEQPAAATSGFDNKNFRGTVILIHGLLMRAPSMRTLISRFAREGFRCFCYDYPSSRLGIFRQGEILRERLRDLTETLPPNEKLFFATHSMGGVLLRIALENFSEEELSRIDSIVMFAPPNQGSFWPERVRRIFPLARFFNRCLGDLRATEDSPLRRISLPKHGMFPRLLIVGGKQDAKVAPEFLPLPGVSASVVFAACGHARLRHSREAFEYALQFFDKNESAKRS